MAYESFLSQEEVDALIADTRGEKEESKPVVQEDPNAIRRYDLGSTDRVVRRRMQTLELINERFARGLRGALLTFMRRNADISVGAIQIQKYSDFERNLPVPSNLNMVKLSPLRGTALFAFDPLLVFLVIESLFGGQARQTTRIEGRDFTATEQRIIKRLLDHTMDCYTRAWSGIFDLEYSYVRSEMHTKFASVSTGNEVVVVTPVHIEFGSMGGKLNVCLPYSMIEPIREALIRPNQDNADKFEDARWTNQLTSQVRHAEVELAAKFATIPITIGKLFKLEKGAVLPIELPKTVVATVDNVPVLQCRYGESNKRYALSVEKHLEASNYEFLSEKTK